MVDKRKMSLVPPQVKSSDKLKQFIEEPDKKVQLPEPEQSPTVQEEREKPEQKKTPKKAQFPWEAPGVTPEIIKPFVLRMKQPDKLKADFIVENSLEFRSLQDFCMKAIMKLIEKELKKLGT
jgi:hypothetical protein